MQRTPLLLRGAVALALVAACGSEPSAPPVPASAANEPADARPLAVPEPTPAKVDVPPKIDAPALPAVDAPHDDSPALQLVAVRSDSAALLALGGQPWLTFEGEPVPLVGGAFERLPQGSKGMLECWAGESWSCHIAALAGSPSGPLGQWLTVVESFERVGDAYRGYHRKGDAWREVTRREGPLVGHHDPIVEREGAVIGLLHWSPDPVEELRANEAKDDRSQQLADARYQARRDKALRGAKGGFERLAGPEVPLPRVPEGLTLVATTTTTEGAIVAVARPHEQQHEASGARLLVWAPTAVEPTSVDVPALESVRNVKLWSGEGWTMISGCLSSESEDDDGSCPETYLVLGEGDTWQRIPISLPERSPRTREVMGAARSPDGALWLALGNSWVEDDDILVNDPLWYRPAKGEWRAATLPTLEHPMLAAEVRGQPRWKAYGLVWGANAVWATLLDRQFHTVVLTTQPGSTPVIVLPSKDQADADRAPLPKIFEDFQE